jgi:hypothetical protein
MGTARGALRPSRRKAEALHRSARETAKKIATGWGPEDAAAVGLYDAPGAVIVFGHPPNGYFAVVWDEGAYEAKPEETRVGIWDGLFVMHGQQLR